MKKIILSITILLSIAAICQAQIIGIESVSGRDMGYAIESYNGDTFVSSISRDTTGNFWIEGTDSLGAIKLLWDDLETTQKRQIDAYKREEVYVNVILKAIAFTNEVPDYFKDSKNNKAWKKYLAALNTIGFGIVKKKKK